MFTIHQNLPLWDVLVQVSEMLPTSDGENTRLLLSFNTAMASLATTESFDFWTWRTLRKRLRNWTRVDSLDLQGQVKALKKTMPCGLWK